MTHMKSAIFGFALTVLAAPAFAGGFTFELPRLSFPEPTPPVVTQTCTSPVVLGAASCTDK